MDTFINPVFHSYYQKHPIRLIDVGARGGLNNNWRKAKRFLSLIGFEPDARAFEDLKKNSAASEVYINSALDKEKKKIDFYHTKQGGLSSIFRPRYDFLKQFPEWERFAVSEITKEEVDSLDSQLEKHRLEDIDFIKLDTQGNELYILEGAGVALSNVFGLEVEVEFSQMYEGQPLFSDLDKFIRNLGFQLFDLRPCYWKRKEGKRYGGLKGQLIFAEALYFLRLEQIRERLDRIQDPALRKAKILKSISIALLYGYIDYALEIFGKEKGLFSAEETKVFYKEVKKTVPVAIRIPYFRGRGRIARLFKFFYNIFRYHHNDWSIGQEFLGNLE